MPRLVLLGVSLPEFGSSGPNSGVRHLNTAMSCWVAAPWEVRRVAALRAPVQQVQAQAPVQQVPVLQVEALRALVQQVRE